MVDMYIYQNSQKYNQQDLCRLSLLFFFAEIRRCLFGVPCSRRIGSFVLYHRNPYTHAEKNRFWKTQDTGYRFSDASVWKDTQVTCTSTRIRSLSCAELAQKAKNVRRIHP